MEPVCIFQSVDTNSNSMCLGLATGQSPREVSMGKVLASRLSSFRLGGES